MLAKDCSVPLYIIGLYLYYRDSRNLQCSVVAFVGDASLGFVLKKDYSSNSSPHQFCVVLVQIFGRSSAWPKILSHW